MKANLESRIASRILWLLAEKNYRTEKDLYQLAKSVDWDELFEVQRTIKVNVSAIRSPLPSLDFAGLTVKDAICDRFREKTGERPSVNTSMPDMRIHLFLTDKQAILYLDTSGEPLFKRGYRVAQGEAPLRENLAAGILALTHWQPTEALYDPMCGSGTFLIEAAQMALNIAPGRTRHFAFENMIGFNAKQWREYRADRLQAEKPKAVLPIYGSDLSGEMVACAHHNLAAAGLADVVTLKQVNMLECSAPAPSGVIVTNPPYGVRLSDQQALDALYPQLGHILKQKFTGWRAYFLSADPMLAKTIRLAASKRTPLFNGGLECRLLEYHLISGSNRKK
jgi:putative N6-adenine-specific DNA methylase